MKEVRTIGHSYLVSLINLEKATVAMVEDIELIIEVAYEGRSYVVGLEAKRVRVVVEDYSLLRPVESVCRRCQPDIARCVVAAARTVKIRGSVPNSCALVDHVVDSINVYNTRGDDVLRIPCAEF